MRPKIQFHIGLLQQPASCAVSNGRMIDRRRIQNADNRPGFTLVELLVVIAIIGILISIILPAISAVRATSRATVCKSNIRQIAMAIHAYAEQNNGKLPAQWRAATPVQWKNFSWTVAILPMIDQQNLHDKLDLDQAPFAPANLPYTSISIPVFECPSTPSEPRYISTLGGGQYEIPGGNAAAKDYVAIHSVTSSRGDTIIPGAWNGQSQVFDVNEADRTGLAEEDVAIPSNPGGSDFVADSFNAQVRTIRAALSGSSIRDGLGNTALLIEQAGKPEFYGSDAMQSPFPDMHSTGISEGPWATAELNNFSGNGVNANNRNDPYGFHRSAHVAMCDSSVHAWSPSIDPIILRSLLSRSGREIVNLSDVH